MISQLCFQKVSFLRMSKLVLRIIYSETSEMCPPWDKSKSLGPIIGVFTSQRSFHNVKDINGTEGNCVHIRRCSHL